MIPGAQFGSDWPEPSAARGANDNWSPYADEGLMADTRRTIIRWALYALYTAAVLGGMYVAFLAGWGKL